MKGVKSEFSIPHGTCATDGCFHLNSSEEREEFVSDFFFISLLALDTN